MEIKELITRPDISPNKNLPMAYNQFNQLLVELRKKELPDGLISSINTEVEQINVVQDSEKELRKQLRKTQTTVLKLIEKELKLVTRNHYRKVWLAIGMTALGVPLGVVFGSSLGNMAYFGIGLPIGLSIGITIGTNMDKKALAEGRQLDLEIKY